MQPQTVGGVTPYLTIPAGTDGAKAAVEFYGRAFDAVEFLRHPSDDGERLIHSHLGINGASVMLSDDFPEYMNGQVTAPPSAVTLHLQVDDADRWFERAVAAGASVVMPLGDQFWGDRYGQLRDPFGHLWSIGAPIHTGGG